MYLYIYTHNCLYIYIHSDICIYLHMYIYLFTNTHTIPHTPHRKAIARGQEHQPRVLFAVIALRSLTVHEPS